MPMDGLTIFIGFSVLCLIALFIWLYTISKIILPRLLKREVSKYGFSIIKIKRTSYKDEPLPFKDDVEFGDFIFLGENSANQDFVRKVYFSDTEGNQCVVFAKICVRGLKKRTDVYFSPPLKEFA